MSGKKERRTMPENSAIYKKFGSYQEFEEWFDQLLIQHPYNYSSSKRTKGIESAKRKVPIKAELKFYTKRLDCVLGGKPYQKKGQGIRKSR